VWPALGFAAVVVGWPSFLLLLEWAGDWFS
jgi:hypothetical protein